MDAHSVVDDWDVAPFDGGFDGIDELASTGFSGAIEAGDTWLFLREGEALAVVSELGGDPHPGDIDAFDGASGQRHEAPTAGVAALAAMLALDGDVRGRYFTDDTSLDAVDDTLSSGGFTGYVELSENVLSGDYYYVYVDGDVDHVGFVGSSGFLTGEEAESRARGEVGIYDVVAVRLPRPTLPEPEPEPDDEPEPTPGSRPEPDSDPEPKPEPDSGPEPMPGSEPDDEPDSGPRPNSGPTSADTNASGMWEEVGTAGSSSETATPEKGDGAAGPEGVTTGETGSGVGGDSDTASTPEGAGSTEEDTTGHADEADPGSDHPADGAAPGAPEAETGDPDRRSGRETAAVADPETGEGSEEPSTDEPTDGMEAVTARAVPSIDPEKSGQEEPDPRPEGGADGRSTRSRPTDAGQSGSADASPGRTEAEYESRIEAYEARIGELEAAVEDADARIGELERELESVRAERDELRERLGPTDTAATESLSRAEALAGTRLFVRENSRGEGTLSDAHGGADREAVVGNLRIEYHTGFDDAAVSIDGEPFEEWLESSDIYGFVEWLVFELLFEIRSAGAVDGVRPLYDAIPGIDRIGFAETVTVGDGADGREVEFDAVVRDKKGNPLVVVTFDEGRDPTRADVIEPLVTDASDVCADHDTLAAAVAITSSYFESDAMAAVGEATSSSLLSRSKHRSYVTLARSNGFHLCLVEARDGSFNLTTPDL